MSGAYDAVLQAAAKLPDGKLVSRQRSRLMLVAIDKTRLAQGLSARDLADRAGISERAYWFQLRAQRVPKAVTLRRLARVVAGQPADGPADRGLLETLAIEATAARLTASGITGQACREAVIYSAHVGLGLTQKAAALHAGVTPQRVSVVVRKIEDQRDCDPALDRALDAAMTAGGAL